MQNLLVHVACHPRQKHVMYVRGKINLSERERERVLVNILHSQGRVTRV
jgi:hypothetical protein